MAIAFVQKSASAAVGTGVTSITVTLPANVSSSNLTALDITLNTTQTITCDAGMGYTSGTTATTGNSKWTFVLQTTVPSPNTDVAQTWFGPKSSGGSASVVVNSGAAANITGAAAEFSGAMAGTSALAGSTFRTGGTSSASTPADVSADLHIICETDEAGLAQLGGPSGGFTVIADDHTNQNFLTGYKVVTASTSSGWDLAGATTWGTLIASYNVATAGGAASVVTPRLFALLGVGA